MPSTPASSRLLGLINRFKSPSLDYIEYEDLPMPVFECDWMNDSTSITTTTTPSHTTTSPHRITHTLFLTDAISHPAPTTAITRDTSTTHTLEGLSTFESDPTLNHPQSSPSLLSSSFSHRVPVPRLLALDRSLETSQSTSSSTSLHPSSLLETVTPGLPRPGLNSSKRIASKWKPPTAASTGKPLRRATRVPVAESSALEDEENEGASEGGSQSPDVEASLTAPTSLQPLRSRSALGSSSSSFSRAEDDYPTSSTSSSAATVTLSASAYLNRIRRVPSESISSSASSHINRTLSADSSADLSPPLLQNIRPSVSAPRARYATTATTTTNKLTSLSNSIPSRERALVPDSPIESSSLSTSLTSSSSSFLTHSTCSSRESTPPQSESSYNNNNQVRNESREMRRNQIRLETSTRLGISIGGTRTPREEQRSLSTLASYGTNLAGERLTPVEREAGGGGAEDRSRLRRGLDRDLYQYQTGVTTLDHGTTTLCQNFIPPASSISSGWVERGETKGRNVMSGGERGGRAEFTPKSSSVPGGQQPLGTSVASSSSIGSRGERCPLPPSTMMQDENSYDSRTTRLPFAAAADDDNFSNQVRPVLVETFRASNFSDPAADSPPLLGKFVTQERSYAPLPPPPPHASPPPPPPPARSSSISRMRDTQIPLKDHSPGLTELATPQLRSLPNYVHQIRPPTSLTRPSLGQEGQQEQTYAMSRATVVPVKEVKKKSYTSWIIQGVRYSRIDIIGKGGSSKVWRVINSDNQILALKKVDIKSYDKESRESFINEIELLERLRGHPQIIGLIAAEMNDKSLMMVMELGEVDLNVLLSGHLDKSISMNFIRYIWEQMLEAVSVIHSLAIVHTDLKPANFVLVKGRLKLIDFGISKAIGNDTTNIGRDQQIGTANYMPPEALLDSGMGAGGKRLMKLGRASDIWSLGCILYQMVYSHTPFSPYKDISRKILAIQNPLHVIHFPSFAIPTDSKGREMKELGVKVGEDCLEAMKGCLKFESRERWGIPELLQGDFLRSQGTLSLKSGSKEPTIEIDEKMLAEITQRVAMMLMGKKLSPIDAAMAAQKLFNQGLEARGGR